MEGLYASGHKLHHFNEEQDSDLHQSKKSAPDPRRNEQAGQDLHQVEADPQHCEGKSATLRTRLETRFG